MTEQKRRELGWCEEAQTYCSCNEEAYQQGRADAIEELKPFIHTNVKGNIFIFIEDYNVDKLSFAEQLKEQRGE